MARKGHREVRHPKLFKRLTIGGSIFGLVSILTLTTTLILDMVGVNKFETDELRQYRAKFINEGTVVSEAVYNRGEILQVPANPTKMMDDKHDNYVFLGWDTTGEGIPDILPHRMYYSFTAKAVYFGYGKINLSIEDLLKMDPETLLNLLERLGLDWQKLMDLLNLSLDDLMKLLDYLKIFEFETDTITPYPTYFRTTSYGDFDYSKKRYNEPSIYTVSNASVHPLRYTADHTQVALGGGLIKNLEYNFANYNITYYNSKAPYPVPDCERQTDYSLNVNSDAYLLTNPVNKHYQSSAIYCPAYRKVIDVLKLTGFTDPNTIREERDYYQYALKHYTSVPKAYINTIDSIIESNGFEPEDYYYVDEIGKYVESVGVSNIIPTDDGYTLDTRKNKDPVLDLLKNQIGSDFDFNTLAIMIFRRLNIPARMVRGYLTAPSSETVQTVTLLNQHYWCEIYVKNIGWMICDCMNVKNLIGENPYGGDFDQEDNPISDEETPTPEDPPIPPDPPEEFIEDEQITEDLSGKVSNSGPGDKLDKDVKEIFQFSSPYQGTLYFRSKSYNYYNSSGEWFNNINDYNYTYTGIVNPNVFAFNATKKFFSSQSVTVYYTQNMKYGVSPDYVNRIDSTYSEGIFDSYCGYEVESGSQFTYSSVMFPLEVNQLRKISNDNFNSDYTTISSYQEYQNEITQMYLEVNPVLHSPIETLLSETGFDYGADKFEAVINVKNIIQNNFVYNINFAEYPEYQDPIISFINSREGICNNFASLATMIYRYIGLPARFVTGYGAESLGGTTRVSVNNLKAHAWCEVFLDNIGWVMVDATGFEDGHYDGEYYGGGFSGGGAYQFEPIVKKEKLTVKNYNMDTYGDINKEYDKSPLENSFYISNSEVIATGHRVEIDDSKFVEATIGEPCMYEITPLVNVKVYDENNEDVTTKLYTIDYSSLGWLSVNEREAIFNINYNGPTYSGTDFTPEAQYFEVYGDNLLPGHTATFVPTFIIDDSTEIEITGTITIRDENGNDVTDCYYIQIQNSYIRQ